MTWHRDSDDIECVNYDYMTRVCRERFVLGEDFDVERSAHFAVGWIDSLIINPANADLYGAIVELWDRIDEYPCLDDDLLVQYEMAEDVDDSSPGDYSSDNEKESEDA